MKIFSKEEIQQKRKAQSRDLLLKNQKLASSLRKIIKLQNDVEFDAEKAKKVRDFEIYCKDMQIKQSKELETLNRYSRLCDEKKDEYFEKVAQIDQLEDKKIELEEAIEKLEVQIKWKEQLVTK